MTPPKATLQFTERFYIDPPFFTPLNSDLWLNFPFDEFGEAWYSVKIWFHPYGESDGNGHRGSQASRH